jgi:AraC-like DNA-binding protein
LRPYGAAAIVTGPQHDLVGQTLGLDLLSRQLARSLDQVRERADGTEDAAQRIQQVLASRVDEGRIGCQIRAAVGQIQRTRGLVTVDGLAEQIGLTPRHLERRFKQIVGISPKRLARITRFQHALRLFERIDSPQRGTHTAVMCGYADQAHFIRDFTEFAGCAPVRVSRLLRACAPLAGRCRASALPCSSCWWGIRSSTAILEASGCRPSSESAWGSGCVT